MQQGKRRLRFITWNVRGLNAPRKVRLVMSYLNRHKIDVSLFQEMHSTPATAVHLKASWVDAVYHATYSSFSRGVVMVLRRGLPLHVSKVLASAEAS